ncbi:hypothetical protein [Micromonospora sp. GCM10011541]|uniref:hypothetical protein n=1 Tax=Micromonospora sp. GCM10011541 TaxID=3317336 RepID=UPI00360D90E6
MSTFTFAKPSEFQGGTFFKPAEHMNDLALLIEPKSLAKDRPHTYQNKTTTRDEVTADVTVFPTEESLDKSAPVVIKNAVFTHFMLTDTLQKVGMGGVTVAVIRKVPTKAGSGYAFRDVDASTEGKVGNYYVNREKAITEALASVPDFD